MKKIRRTRYVVVVALLCLAATSPRPVLHSPRGGQVFAPRALAVIPGKSMVLDWAYPLPLPREGVEFDIEATEDFVTWRKLATTNSPPYVVENNTRFAMLRVGAHRTE